MLSPEEIQKEFEDFVKRRFGENVQVVTHKVGFENENSVAEGLDAEVQEPEEPRPSKPFHPDLQFDLKPRDIKSYLDRYVIKQDEAKKALSIAVCDHYNQVKRSQAGLASDEFNKQNVLLLGPTGVGKTYLVKQIAKLIGVPFVKADATRFSETGYVGANVDDLVHDLVAQANGDLNLAQYGIIYLDEADKLAGHHNGQVRDVNGRGVQFALLKLMEETDVDLRGGNDMRSQMQAFMDMQKRGKAEPKIVNTKNILFIVSGSFGGLKEIIATRLQKRAIGFSRVKDSADHDVHLLNLAETTDFIQFGFEPEFIGRLPVRVACMDLKANDLFLVLKESKGSLVAQYEACFHAYGISISFTDGALQLIAEKAALEKTGARGLMTVCERILRDFKFELPSRMIDQLVVDDATVADPEAALQKLIATYPLRSGLKAQSTYTQH